MSGKKGAVHSDGNKKWNEAAIAELRKLYPVSTPGKLARHFNTTPAAIVAAASKNKIKSSRAWSATDKALLTRIYPTHDNADIAATLGISERAVRSAATSFGLKKSARYWSIEDCKWLIDHWGAPGYGFPEIQAHFANKTKWAIINKYRSLAGLRVDNKNK